MSENGYISVPAIDRNPARQELLMKDLVVGKTYSDITSVTTEDRWEYLFAKLVSGEVTEKYMRKTTGLSPVTFYRMLSEYETEHSIE